MSMHRTRFVSWILHFDPFVSLLLFMSLHPGVTLLLKGRQMTKIFELPPRRLFLTYFEVRAQLEKFFNLYTLYNTKCVLKSRG